jgi:hypothetical protein
MGNTAVKETVTVGIFRTHAEAEAAIEQLRLGGFDLKRLSIAGKDYETREDVVGYYTTGDRMKRWGAAGAFWGGIWGLLFGAAFFLVPGVGPCSLRVRSWRPSLSPGVCRHRRRDQRDWCRSLQPRDSEGQRCSCTKRRFAPASSS